MTRTAAITLLFLPLAAAAAEPSLKAFEEGVQKVVDAASPAVVAVVVSHSKEHSAPPKGKPWQLGPVDPNDIRLPEERRPRFLPKQGNPPPHPLDLSAADNVADHTFGSGVVLDAAAGLVLVPYHLIDGARKVYVRGPGGKGSYADIHAADSKSDLAVLKLLGGVPGLKAVKLAEVRLIESTDGEKPTLKKGAFIVALGHPTATAAGDGSASASWGVVSNTRQRSAPPPVPSGPPPLLAAAKPLHQYGGLIQVDARVALGNTGAAIFNADGELVALGSGVAAVWGSEANGGYAVPMDPLYRRIIAVLKKGEEVEYGFLGISPVDAGGEVMVGGVTAGCPAMLAGLVENDVITAVDGNPLKTNDDLLHHVGGALAGTQVKVDYLRGGRAASVNLTLAKNLNTLPYLASNPPPTPFGIKVDYYSVRHAGGGPRDLRPKTVPPGVLVRELADGSGGKRALDDAGAPKAGAWLITHVDGKPVGTPKEFYAATKDKTAVKLHLADPDEPLVRKEVSVP